ncbi:hypothetical protein OIU77_003972 [Salix suchowensis]|uniref:Uncharacterized protein n=1 Tax=Salix suchowensis TaxID=1278906 RepID=A0ABQ9AUC9_9ROSI|nr:hypothetical protein OIU77_003972 [Salix suchowensis]
MEMNSGASPLSGKLFVVLGAGGAGKSLAYGAARVVVANRTFGNALAMRNFHPEDGMVLANTTSVGMTPHTDATPLAKKLKN